MVTHVCAAISRAHLCRTRVAWESAPRARWQFFTPESGAGGGGLIVASVLFGAAHLWFRGFPNWKWLAIASVLGWFCGRARNQAGSIRAAMVTHALVITAWRAFFA